MNGNLPIALFLVDIFLRRRAVEVILQVRHDESLFFFGQEFRMAWIVRHEKQANNSVQCGDSAFYEEDPVIINQIEVLRFTLTPTMAICCIHQL